MSVLLGRAAATRGVLLRLREQLEFVNRGRELLKMKRDHLASEVNRLLKKIRVRQTVDRQLMEAYEKLKATYSSLGYSSTASEASTVGELEVRVRPISIMGVVVPEVLLGKKPKIDYIPSLSAYEAAREVNAAIKDLLELAETEAQIEAIAQELMMVNRKVNALDKVLIPSMLELIRYIEGRLEEEMLEEFFRAKRVRAAIRTRR